jgi:hypothetical protein
VEAAKLRDVADNVYASITFPDKIEWSSGQAREHFDEVSEKTKLQR